MNVLFNSKKPQQTTHSSSIPPGAAIPPHPRLPSDPSCVHSRPHPGANAAPAPAAAPDGHRPAAATTAGAAAPHHGGPYGCSAGAADQRPDGAAGHPVGPPAAGCGCSRSAGEGLAVHHAAEEPTQVNTCGWGVKRRLVGRRFRSDSV